MSTEITRALSVQQPWASALLMQGPRRKWLENRGKPLFRVPDEGMWIGVHAGLALHPWAEQCLALAPELAAAPLPRGALLGAVEALAWVEVEDVAGDPWAHGPWCLVIGRAVALPAPIPMRGMLGLWTLPEPVEIDIGG